MSKKTPKWQRKLNASERRHLKETLNSVTLTNFKATLKWQRRRDIDCLDCEFIARKLGIE